VSWFGRLALPGLAQGAALIDVAPSAARPIGLNTCSKSCAGAKGQPLANQPPRNGTGNGRLLPGSSSVRAPRCEHGTEGGQHDGQVDSQ